MVSSNINVNFKGGTLINPPLYPVNNVQTKSAPQSFDTYTPSAGSSSSATKKTLSKIQDSFLPDISPKAFIDKYSNRNFVERAIQNNPNITQILEKNNIPIKIEEENIRASIDSHFIPTSKYANMIMKNSGETFSKNDYKVMKQAALLHDIGKILVPFEVLNKKGKLTDQEYNIIKLHEELGYEILRSSDLDPDVINLVNSHHDYKNKAARTTLAQILSVADIYSALKENRPYRSALSNEEAFEILEQGAKEGKYDIKYVNILKESV